MVEITGVWRLAWENAQSVDASGQDEYAPLAEDNIHRYPAKMFPPLANLFLDRALDRLGRPPREATLFDPYCGSGTALLLGKLRGMRVAGSDLLEMAVIIASAKINLLTMKELDVLGSACQVKIARKHIPDRLDAWEYRDLWFADEVYGTLMALREWVSQFRDAAAYPHLMTALGQTVWDVSAADPDVIVPTRSKRSPTPPLLTADDVIRQFRRRAERVVEAQTRLRERQLPRCRSRVKLADARCPSTWPVRYYDIVLCSPPYGDGIDYRRALSLQSRFFQFEDRFCGQKLTECLTGRRSHMAATTLEEHVPVVVRGCRWFRALVTAAPDRALSLACYLGDLRCALQALRSRFFSDGLLGMVIGDPEMAGVRIPLASLVSFLALQEGFAFASPPTCDQIRKRCQTPVRRSSREPISREYLLEFQLAG